MVSLSKVKNALGVTGTYQDNTILVYINEVVAFLVDAGVPQDNITDGIVARGVSDLWNYGAGEGELSDYFKTRAIQLALHKTSSSFEPIEPDDPEDWEYTTDEDIDDLFD